MTPAAFRRIALSMPDAIEGTHHGHPDFRANGRVFATLHPDGARGMVRVAPEEQQRLLRDHPDAFEPANGAWGRQGCTMVLLAAVDAATLRLVMTLAWQRTLQPISRKGGARARSPSRGSRSRPRSRPR